MKSKLPASIEQFLSDEDGAVTVDWVVLTAAIIGLSALLFPRINQGIDSLATATKDEMASITVEIPGL
jgi:hypothetical protein